MIWSPFETYLFWGSQIVAWTGLTLGIPAYCILAARDARILARRKS